MVYILLLCFLSVLRADIIQDATDAFYQQDFERARTLFEQMLVVMPHQHNLLYNLACCYEKLGDKDKAKSYCLQSIAAQASYIRPYQKLFELIDHTREREYAKELGKHILELDPNAPRGWINLGKLYLDDHDYEQAALCFRTASTHTADHSTTFELAYLLSSLGLFNEAVLLYERMLPELGDIADLHQSIGYCLRCAGRFDEAICAYERAIACGADSELAHFGHAMAYIFQGDYAHGWQLHQHFLKSRGRNAEKLRSWLSTHNLHHKTVLLSPEGGLGDTLQFVRYARELKKYGCTVAVATQPPLYKLLSRCPYIDHLYKTGSQPTIAIDDWTTLMSIAPILYTYEQQLPAFSPYIFANPTLVDAWRAYFAHDHNLKVGICWQASVQNDVSRPAVARRGIPLQECIPLATVAHISLYSLQQQDGVEQLAQLPSWVNIHSFDETFDKQHGAFEDTAAVLEHLDLLITIDSAVAHLAGAMGKEVWLLLPYATDWRWVHDKTTTDWYPNMRIFKQATPFDWQGVIERVRDALVEKVINVRQQP